MDGFIENHFNHFLFVMLLFARCGDIFTTWLASPKLQHEANPVTVKFGWFYGAATIALSVVAYWSEPFALALLSISLCVSASNASKVWIMRTLGETDYHSLVVSVMQRSSLGKALTFNCMPAVFYFALGGMIHIVEGEETRAYYLGTGILAYAMAILVFYPWRYYRLHQSSRAV